MSLDTPRCVSCSSRKHRQVSCHCVVFSGWRVMYVCGVGAVSLRSCFSAAGDSCVPLPLLTGLSRSVGCAFLQNCTYRGTLGALGPWTAPRISHSPSSCRACNLRLHGHHHWLFALRSLSDKALSFRSCHCRPSGPR